MANVKKALSNNVEGNIFVDESCINCAACRHFAPATFADGGNYSLVKKQTENDEEAFAAKQAIISCPVAAIGMREREDLKAVKDSLPMEMAKNVYINGFNHRKSYGAHSYLIKSEAGNWLIDSPRFTPHLIKKFEEMGGIKYIFLTHQDDVGDAHRYAEHFGAQRIIHQFDSEVQKEAEIILEGTEAQIFDQAEIHYTPGHTKGHLTLLWDNKYLFTGDHYAWLSSLNQFGSFRSYCWDWQKQIESVQLMAAFEKVEWVFPGHGKWGKIDEGQFPKVIRKSVDWMKKID